MINFTLIKSLTIPEGAVKSIISLPNGTTLWTHSYTNLVPLSIDTDGSIFQGTGYIEGYRFSSSGNLSAQAGTISTGFIPCTASDVIRMGGVDWRPDSGYCYLMFYDAAFTLLGSINVYPSTNTGNEDGYFGASRGICVFKDNGRDKVSTTDNSGVTTFDNYEFSDGSAIAYFRLNGYGNGEDMIVTVNEDIYV